MKKLFIISILSVAALAVKAQATLQFNQVLMVGNSAQTVPVGKVWKVESYIMNNNNAAINGSANCTGTGGTIASLFQMAVPSGTLTNFFVRPVNSNPASTGQWGFGATFPIWLPAGSQLASNCSTWYLSVIEFNIVN